MRILILSIVLAACGSKQPPPPPPPPDAAPELAMDEATARDTADGLLEVLATMAAIVEQRAGDCPAMAAELGALFDQAAPLFEITEAARQDPEATRLLGEAMKAHEMAVTPLVDRIGPGLEACKDDPALVEAMQRMPVI